MFKKEVNLIYEKLSEKQIELLARLKLRELIRKGCTEKMIKDSLKELIEINPVKK